MMVCALAKYCSMFHVSPSYIPIWESCTRRYILSVPWTRFIELRVATGKGSRYGRVRSCDHDSILFYPPKGWKKLWKNRVSISFCRNPIYRWFIPRSTVLFCHRKKRYDFYRILVLRFYCTNIGSVLSKLQSFLHATLRALFYHFIAEIRRNVRSKRILTI